MNTVMPLCREIFVYITLYHSTAITVAFGQSEYIIRENAGPAQPVLVLSNPSSTDITVQVTDTENTATSE